MPILFLTPSALRGGGVSIRTFLILAAIAALSVPVQAEHCVPTTSEPEVAVAGQYIDNDLCQPECLFSIWFYTESNGIDGLQRADEVVDDTCGGEIGADSLTFY